MKSTLVAGALCLAVGLGVGALFAGTSSTSTFSVEKHVVRGEQGTAMSRQEMAAIVREELARGRPGVAQATAAEPTETGDEARERMTDEQADNADRAARIVDSAVARGAWTEQDKRDLWILLTDVPGPVQREVFQKLGVAINNNRLRIETDGMPL
jgi:hypothetical protein